MSHNAPVGRHTDGRTPPEGSRSSYAAAGPRRRTLVALALLVTGALVAWGVLVYAAIDFGAQARSGRSGAWVLLALATVGAAACLFVTLLLGARIVALVRGRQAPVARPLGGRRAKR